MSTIHLSPAYGRDYKTKAAVIEAYQSGADFITQAPGSRWDGKPTSIRDHPGIQVQLRFNRLRQAALYNPNELTADERIVLNVTCAHVARARRAEAKLTPARYDAAKRSLIAKRLLNLNGAPTAAGRQARSD